MRSRSSARQTIREGTFDVCIIGGGATGTGCALDAQLRGLSTVLLDAGDFVHTPRQPPPSWFTAGYGTWSRP